MHQHSLFLFVAMWLSRASSPLKGSYPCFVGSKPVHTSSSLAVFDKYTQEVATHVSLASPEHIEAAIKAAQNARKPMQDFSLFKRKEVLLQVADQLSSRREELAHTLCVEAGKPVNDARAEVLRAIDTITACAEEAVRPVGDFGSSEISKHNAGLNTLVSRVPVGPVSMVSPFNFPLNLVAHKAGPAIAAGCPFVLKPSDRTPVSALIFGDILSHTDLPEGAFSIVPCHTEHASPLTTDERFKVLSFTGSERVGWALKNQAGKKNVILELGGNAACVADETANVQNVADRLAFGAFAYQGQSCISVQRVLLHDSIYHSVKEKLVAKAASLTKGDPMDPQNFLGPLITEDDAKRCEQWVQEAVAGGAKILTGGNREGAMYEPTVLEAVGAEEKVRCEEVFGPVCILDAFSHFKDAMEMVNRSNYGLQAGIFTQLLNRAFYAYNTLEVGGVVINDIPSVRVDTKPYGGVKASGIGREGVKSAIEHFTEVRVMNFRGLGQL